MLFDSAYIYQIIERRTTHNATYEKWENWDAQLPNIKDPTHQYWRGHSPYIDGEVTRLYLLKRLSFPFGVSLCRNR